ncbi:hypothetical protein FH609_008545 [Streptomyces sp. 3MP-14]|uniref:Uncharacterized protein n=1 Tax=Streptomyces mimosae TaxID=2586635 RepID=A0A5N6AL03_9ACTN|nr:MULTISPECIES: hypothetical protein [Streptomyces]KAB8168570.1 hypothetical protein FH607_004820 [Streptomyces mimosae]KAB8178148.1 hypothetical protein FH609_008545 [Streptomyces sp. 3MP-14]
MPSSDISPSDARRAAPALAIDQAEAVLVEHYPRLVRLGYLILPPSLGRHRRVLGAHAVAQRALPRGRSAEETPPVLPAQRAGGTAPAPAPATDAGYALLRLRVVRAALAAQRPVRFAGREFGWPPRAPLPLSLPRVWGLRLFPRAGEPEEVALDQRLGALSATARAAYALRRIDELSPAEIRLLLAGAGEPEQRIEAAMAAADAVESEAPLVDPCALQARPTDLLRRRQRTRTALVGAVAVAVVGCGFAVFPDGWGPDGAAAPPYSENAAAQAALDPASLRRMPADAWRQAARTDFSVWPARGSALDDTGLLRRALAVWARPGDEVRVSATPGTQTGPPPGPAQLLFAGEVGGISVVLLHDGLRLVRYAEPTGAREGEVVLDLARVDGAGLSGASAVVVQRGDGNTRYLLAPWVTEAASADLLVPGRPAAELPVDEHGVSGPLHSARQDGACTEVPALHLTADGAAGSGGAESGGPLLLADLGELTPALLTRGAPGVAGDGGSVAATREAWGPLACQLASIGGAGVRSVNAWEFAEQSLPEDGGTARWVCGRAETWRGTGARVWTQFLDPSHEEDDGAVKTAAAEDVPSCGERQPAVLSGMLWRSQDAGWFLLAAGSEEVVEIAAGGAVTGRGEGRTVALPAEEGAQARLTATLADGGELAMLGD